MARVGISSVVILRRLSYAVAAVWLVFVYWYFYLYDPACSHQSPPCKLFMQRVTWPLGTFLHDVLEHFSIGSAQQVVAVFYFAVMMGLLPAGLLIASAHLVLRRDRGDEWIWPAFKVGTTWLLFAVGIVVTLDPVYSSLVRPLELVPQSSPASPSLASPLPVRPKCTGEATERIIGWSMYCGQLPNATPEGCWRVQRELEDRYNCWF